MRDRTLKAIAVVMMAGGCLGAFVCTTVFFHQLSGRHSLNAIFLAGVALQAFNGLVGFSLWRGRSIGKAMLLNASQVPDITLFDVQLFWFSGLQVTPSLGSDSSGPASALDISIGGAGLSAWSTGDPERMTIGVNLAALFIAWILFRAWRDGLRPADPREAESARLGRV